MMSMTHQRWIKWYAVICAVAAMLTAASLPAAAAEEHLIAYYSFEDAGNLGKDDSGSGNDLTAVGKGGGVLRRGREGAGTLSGRRIRAGGEGNRRCGFLRRINQLHHQLLC